MQPVHKAPGTPLSCIAESRAYLVRFQMIHQMHISYHTVALQANDAFKNYHDYFIIILNVGSWSNLDLDLAYSLHV